MPRLPNLENAVVADSKLSGYLLDPSHPAGKAKARFLSRFGFDPANIGMFRQALLDHASANEVAAEAAGTYGTRYMIDGPLPSPDGRNPVVRVVWFTPIGEGKPHLVTLIPRSFRST